MSENVCCYLGGTGDDCKRCNDEASIPEFTVKFRDLNISVTHVKAYDFSMAMMEALRKIYGVYGMTRLSDMNITTEQTK